MIWSVLIPVVLLVLIVAGWYAFEGRWNRRLFTAEPGKVCRNLSARQAADWLREHPETQILDVRSESEFASGALPGAVNLPFRDPDFEVKAGTLDRAVPVLVYCAGGFRSRKAVERFKALGFLTIQHIHRGYLSWKHTSIP
jgi:rhodanese-related sulfurtransferase